MDWAIGHHKFRYQEYFQDVSYMLDRIYFDGSCTKDGSGGRWVLYGAHSIHADTMSEWAKIAELSFPLNVGATVTAAELEASVWGIRYLRSRHSGGNDLKQHILNRKPLDTRRFRLLNLSGMIS